MNPVPGRLGGALARFLSRPLATYRPLATSPFSSVDATLRCGDVLLVEGDTRIRYDEVLRIRHRSLFAPRDFDVSPYFSIVKPALEREFDFRGLKWHTAPAVEEMT